MVGKFKYDALSSNHVCLALWALCHNYTLLSIIHLQVLLFLEARPGIEPETKDSKSLMLPLHQRAIFILELKLRIELRSPDYKTGIMPLYDSSFTTTN